MILDRLEKIWFNISYIGIDPNSDNPDKRNIIHGNQIVFILEVSLSLLAVALYYMGIYRGALLLASLVVTFLLLTIIIYKGYFMAGRVAGITMQNLNVVVLSIFLGYETRIIDFLIITTLIPLLLINIQHKKLIAFCVSQNLFLYLSYHLLKNELSSYGLGIDAQMLIYNMGIVIKFVLILMVVYLIVINRDAEEDKLRKGNLELERINTGLKQFAYVTSHDLKTPLRNISTYLQLLRRRNKLDDESNQMIESAVNSVKHLNQLISDIFLYTTTDFKNKLTESVDLNLVMDNIKEDIKAIATEQNVELSIPEKMPTVKVNVTQAMHVFSNLIGNAIKYNTSSKPKVSVSFSRLDDKIEFTVKDNGIGIDKKYHEQIFEIFKRLHTQEEYEGTGIGLAICKKIIESYGGEIRIESETGKGSCFIFTLPAA
ncbi:MAG: ATP-binding protein [Chitinophagales bacterium]